MRRLYESSWTSIALLDLPPVQPSAPALDGLAPGARVLDVGSGLAASSDRRVVSIDLAGAFASCGATGGGANAAARVVADLDDPLPFRDSSFDAALLLDVIEHLVDPAALLAELARVLRPGARLRVTTPNGRFAGHLREWIRGSVPRTVDEAGLLAGLPAPHHGHVSLFTGPELARWLAASGFRVDRHEGTALVAGRLARLAPERWRRAYLAQGVRLDATRSEVPPPLRSAERVSAVVVVHDAGEDLAACLTSLAAIRPPPAVDELLVVDNASRDDGLERAAAALGRFPDARVIVNHENLGFGAALNRALAAARNGRVLVLNPDVTLAPGGVVALEAMFRSDPLTAVAGGLLNRPDGTPALSWAHFPSPRVLAAWFATRRGWLSTAGLLTPREGRAGGGPVGACLLMDRDAVIAAGGFDESFFLYAEELDLFERLRSRGRRVVRAPIVVAVHREGGSTRLVPERARLAWVESHALLLRKHRRRLAGWCFARLVRLDAALASHPVGAT